MLCRSLLCILLVSSDVVARAVHGVVSDDQHRPVAGAVVRLKNTTTLRVRSYRTRKAGIYRFRGLNPNMDYELRASTDGRSSGWVYLSRFDEGADRKLDLTVK